MSCAHSLSFARSVAGRTWLSSEQALRVGVSQRDTSTRKPREYNTRDHDVWGLFGHIWGPWVGFRADSAGLRCPPPLWHSARAKMLAFADKNKKLFFFLSPLERI